LSRGISDLYERARYSAVQFVASGIRGFEALFLLHSRFATISRFSEIAFGHPNGLNGLPIGECH
jgi:hypothetical protein